MSRTVACRSDLMCVYADGHPGPHVHDGEKGTGQERRRHRCRPAGYSRERTYAEATASVDWRLVDQAPIVDLGPCPCGEERVTPVATGFECIACGCVRVPDVKP